MDDKEIHAHIDELIQTEHELRARLAEGKLSGTEETPTPERGRGVP